MGTFFHSPLLNIMHRMHFCSVKSKSNRMRQLIEQARSSTEADQQVLRLPRTRAYIYVSKYV